MRPSAGLMEVFDSRLVEEARATHQSVYFVALLKQKFGEVGTVLAGNSGDQRSLRGGSHNLSRLRGAMCDEWWAVLDSNQ